MAVLFSAAVKNAQMNAIESTIGTSAILRLRSGAPPANVAAASSGTVLATMNLPSDWLGASSAGIVAKLGTWSDTSADAGAPTAAGHFEIVASDTTTRHMQGTVTATGGSGDITLDNVQIAAGQLVSISTFTITGANLNP